MTVVRRDNNESRSNNTSVTNSIKESMNELPHGYDQVLGELKNRIKKARINAVFSVNRELIILYWEIGNTILSRQNEEGWGSKVIEKLAKDLKNEFPDMDGFSHRNLLHMRAFSIHFPNRENVKQLVSQIPWGHIIKLMQKVKDPTERDWYILKTVEHGWSRAVLIHQIDTDLYHRTDTAVTNFESSLPPIQSDLARKIIKDPYIFDFLTLSDDVNEKELEDALVNHIRKFLLELGVGFSFVGNQYHIEVDEEDFYIDLLFYHLKLRCFVVIDLKAGGFKPEYAGKMNFYLAAVDDLLKHPTDNPSIGLILCKTRKRIIAEYALRNNSTPIGVSEYGLSVELPKDLSGYLPTVKQLKREMSITDENVQENSEEENIKNQEGNQ